MAEEVLELALDTEEEDDVELLSEDPDDAEEEDEETDEELDAELALEELLESSAIAGRTDKAITPARATETILFMEKKREMTCRV